MVGKCGPCGTDRLVSKRKCTTNCGWSDWSPEVCEMSPDHCAPGATRNLEDVACGQRCGIAKRTQTCNAMCTWDAVVMSACTKQGVCTPGDQMAAMPAGCNAEYCNKGVQPQVSVCTPSCTWGTPQASGKCEYPDDVCRPADLMGTGYRCILNDPGYRQVCYPSTASPALRCTWGPREQFPGCAR